LDEILYRLRIRKLDQSLRAQANLYNTPTSTSTMPRDLAQTLESLVSHEAYYEHGNELHPQEPFIEYGGLSRSKSFLGQTGDGKATKRRHRVNSGGVGHGTRETEQEGRSTSVGESHTNARRVKSMHGLHWSFNGGHGMSASTSDLRGPVSRSEKRREEGKETSRSTPTSPHRTTVAVVPSSLMMTPLDGTRKKSQ
jgi:hypothetical protein